jgi:hypothetical protein
MADARRAARVRGKSDLIDALAVARAALREGVDALPSAQLAGIELDIRLCAVAPAITSSPEGRSGRARLSASCSRSSRGVWR